MSIWRKGDRRLHSARRLGLAATGLGLVAGLLPVVDGVLPGTAAIARADDGTASLNLMRDGWDSTEPNLSPATVKTFSSAPRWTATVAGSVYAQPLVLGNTVIVATENDQVYALNAGTGAYIWHRTLGEPYPISKVRTFMHPPPKVGPCTDLLPNIGVTGTPAYDPSTGDIFMFANIMTGGKPAYYMVQIDPVTGNIIDKTLIAGHPSNDSHISFSAKFNMERPGVLVLGGAVYGAFASHCDFGHYSGYVARIDIATHAATLWSDVSGNSNNGAGIWQAGGGIMSDGPGRIFVTSGNGISPSRGPGTSPGGNLAESVIRLAVNSDGTLAAQDFFSPANAPKLDAKDWDLGSGAPVGVPFTVGGYNALAQIGKDGRIWLLNRDSLGGRKQGPRGTDNVLYGSKTYKGVWGHPAIFGDTPVTITNSHPHAVDNDFLFSVGKYDTLHVFRFVLKPSGKPWLTNVANSTLTYGYTSGSPVVTSLGDDPASAVIWEVYTPNNATKTGAGSVLEAYVLGNIASTGGKPSPCNSTNMCTLTNIWHSNTFTGAKFSIPATSQGWVYVGARDGHVLGFAAPSAAAPAVATAATLPQTAVGTTSSQAVSVTATKTVTITGATATTSATNATTPTSEFSVGQASETQKGTSTAAPVTLPVTLAPGDKLNVQTSFTPTTPGGSSGTLSLSTTSSTAPTVDVPLTAEGTKQGIYAQPAVQAFPWAPDQGVIPVPIGIQNSEVVNISNLGTVPQTVTAVSSPSPPFSASNLPAVGTKLTPGASIAVQVNFAPTSPGPATGSFIVVGSSGQKAVVTLTGIGAPAVSQLTASTSKVTFGTIRAGQTATAYFQVSNTGNTQIALTGVANASGPFAMPLKSALGLPVSAGSDLLVPVTFAPRRKGTFTGRLLLMWQDVNGQHTLVVTVSGTALRREHEDVVQD